LVYSINYPDYGYGLTAVVIWHLPGGTEENHEKHLSGNTISLADIRADRIWNASQKRYHVIHLALYVTCVSLLCFWPFLVYRFVLMLLRSAQQAVP
jgi:hypothetical protein